MNVWLGSDLAAHDSTSDSDSSNLQFWTATCLGFITQISSEATRLSDTDEEDTF